MEILQGHPFAGYRGQDFQGHATQGRCELCISFQPLPLATHWNWAIYALKSDLPSYGASGTLGPFEVSPYSS